MRWIKIPKNEKEKKKIKYFHRKDAEWLTAEICAEYRRRALQLNSSDSNDAGVRRALRIELQNKCDILEVEAINIINGYGTSAYVKKYEFVKSKLEGNVAEDDSDTDKVVRKEFLEFLQGKEDKKNSLGDYEIEEKD